MFNPDDWLPLADREMTLEQMVENLYAGKLVSNYTEKPRPLKPNLKMMMEKHGSLLQELTRAVVGPAGTITPSNITKPHTGEDFLFYVIGVLMYVEWAVSLQSKKSVKWLGEEIRRKEKARAKMMSYSDGPIDIDFPNQSADTLINLRETLEQTRLRHMTPRIMDMILAHFDIKTARPSDRKKDLDSLQNLLK